MPETLISPETAAQLQRSIPEDKCGFCDKPMGEAPRRTLRCLVNYDGETIKHYACPAHFA